MSRAKAVLTIALTSYFMVVMNVSLVIAALTQIETELLVSTASLTWVQASYTLTFGGFLLLGARAGDILGRRRILLFGLGLFTIASPLVAIADTPTHLFVGRALQGGGAAALAPSSLALLSNTFQQGPDTNSRPAGYGAVAGIGSSLGLVLGGALTDAIS